MYSLSSETISFLTFWIHMHFHLLLLSFHAISTSIFVEGTRVCGGMFDQAAGVHLSSSSAVYRLCAVPTGCSCGLCPCVWRGAEGRRAPEWGSWTGTAGTVLLPQERAVQTAWRSETTHSHTHPNTKIQTHKHLTEDTKRRTRTREMWGRWTRQEDKTKSKRGRESRGKTGEVRVKTQEVQPKRKKWGAERIVGKAESPMETHEEERDTWRGARGGNERSCFHKISQNAEIKEWRSGRINKWRSDWNKKEGMRMVNTNMGQMRAGENP